MRLMRSLGIASGWVQAVSLAAVILVSLPWAVQIWGEVDRKLDELRSSATDNVIWNLTQLEVEFLKYRAATHAARDSTAEDAAALNELRRHFNNYYNRLETLNGGALYQEAFRQYRTLRILTKLRMEIAEVEPFIDSDDATLYARLPEIAKTTEGRQRDVRRIISKGNQYVGVAGQAARDEISRLLWRLSIVVLVLLVALGLASALFFRQSVMNRRRAGEHKRSSVRFSTVISTSPDALIVTDGQGVIVEFNRAAEELFRIEREHAIGKGFIRYLLDQDGQLATLPLTRKERVAGVELTLLTADGTKVPVEVSQGVAEWETQGFYVYFLRDISDRRAADRALMASRDRALSGERAKSRFLAVMSHEMRTPLNGILGLVELLRGNETTDEMERERYLNLLRSSGQILLDHVNDVLDIAQLEADGVRLNPAPFDLDQMMHDLVGPLEVAAKARGLGFHFETTPETLGCYEGDAGRLRQVLTNLIGNAVKFTDAGQVAVSVSVSPADLGLSNRLEFQITDTGAGISEDDVARIFDDFVRLERDGKHLAEGTGLGLGIAKRIIEAMGGKIGVDSIEGEGSSFWITVTLPVCSAVPKAPQDPAQSAGVEVADPVGALRVLVVEDNATNRLVVREMLERDGHTVAEAINGRIGVDMAAAERFDLILMDLNMPVMGGLEACRLIRQSGQNTQSRIVALTAHVLERDDSLYARVGLDGVLSKPLERGDLRRVLAGRSRVRTTEAKQDSLFDLPHLRQVLAALGADKAQKLREGFEKETEALLTRLEQADPKVLAPSTELSTEVHSIAGSCAMIGAQRMRERLNSFESELLQSQRSGAPRVANLNHWRGELRQVWEETRNGLSDLQKAEGAS